VVAGDVFVTGGTAPTAASDGRTDGAGPVVAGVIFVMVPGGPTAEEGPGLGVPGAGLVVPGVAVAAGTGTDPWSSSRLRSLERCAFRA
jgi:hypothetical protein